MLLNEQNFVKRRCPGRSHWYIHQLQKKFDSPNRSVFAAWCRPRTSLKNAWVYWVGWLVVTTQTQFALPTALCTISVSPVHKDSPLSVCCALKCSADMHYLAVPWCWPAPIDPISGRNWYGFYSFRVSLFFLPDASGHWIHPLSKLSLH